MSRAKQKLDWNFVIKWSVGLSIFLFGTMCMTARDFGIRAYYLSAMDNQKISWTAVEDKIIPQIIVGGVVSFILLILSFLVLTLWAYFVRKTPNYSESQIQEKIKPFLTGLLVISAAVGLMFFYYGLVENRDYMLIIEAIAVIALAYFVRSKQNLFVCYVLLAAFLSLLIKYTIVIEGNRLIVIALYTTAICAWIISCSLWKTQLFLKSQPSVDTKNSNTATNNVVDDDFYKTAYEEINSGQFETAIWAKAFANAEGNQEKTKALYIKYRVEQIKYNSTAKENQRKQNEEIKSHEMVVCHNCHSKVAPKNVFTTSGEKHICPKCKRTIKKET